MEEEIASLKAAIRPGEGPCFPGTGPEKASFIEELDQFVFSSIQVLAPLGRSGTAWNEEDVRKSTPCIDAVFGPHLAWDFQSWEGPQDSPCGFVSSTKKNKK